ncbi:S46 family peptidase [Namhaeicola litoreus]|uniref:Dipeptidyl-peptidase n=1 Tax=Namhaeicola litoreus TaxID=1052145 RepID=A0ABW3Y2J5_9FLAO
MKKITLLFMLLTSLIFAQQGGMWIPSLLEGMNEKEINQLGGKLSAKDIYDVNNASLKDAVIHFNGGCTGEIISPQGLILTNHHCGYGAIQSHSTVEKDFLTDGFWAEKLSDELPNPGMYVTFIKSIEDVSSAALHGVSNDMNPSEKQSQIDQNINQILADANKEEWQEAMVKPMYKGNQYMLFITEKFKDIRMVGAPPSSIGKFGSDTDNWMWPRHTGDFSLFRIYADKNNRPAEYSQENQPYVPLHFLPISLDGVEEGDFTMVFGFPGSTDEYLPSFAIDQLVKTINPAKIEIRDNALKIIDKYMRADNKIKIQYAAKYASTANYWKKWIGETQGLTKTDAVAKKQKLESEFQKKVANNRSYSEIIPTFNNYYTELEEIALAQAYWGEVVNRNIELLRQTTQLYQFEEKVTKNPELFEMEREKLLNSLKGFYKNYSAQVDQEVFKKIMEIYVSKSPKKYVIDELNTNSIEELTTQIYSQSNLLDQNKATELLTGNFDEVLKKLNNDVAYAFGKKLCIEYYQNIQPQYQAIQLKINDLQKDYMKGLMETFPKERFFPDANSTLRVTYGQVKGYQPKDAVYYEPVTYLEGVMEKYVPGDYEFDLPEKLMSLYESKNYGSYAENGKLPINFIGTNHTTGGNSGSPALDAQGNLIGLNFDRVWEGTMSDYFYDPSICRNIMVDVRYILFIIDKYAGNQRLMKEMKLVHPKSKKGGN